MDNTPIWQTKEFRDAKKNFIEKGGLKNRCELCKSEKELSPHHKISFRSLIDYFYRKTAIEEMAEEKGFTFTESAIRKSGGFSINRGKGYIRVTELGRFCREHPEFRDKALNNAKKEYLQFNEIQTLCKRCHFAIEKGMELCPYCKKSYFRPNYYSGDFESCFNCKDKARRDQEKFFNEMEEKENMIEEWHRNNFNKREIN